MTPTLRRAAFAAVLVAVLVALELGLETLIPDSSIRQLLMLAAVCAFAAGGATVQRLARCASPLSITWFVHVAGAALLMLHTLLVTPDPLRAITALSAWQWSLMLYSGVLATAIGAVAWSRGIATIGVGRTATYLSWVPVFGVGFGALLLDEALNGWHAVGLCAVLCGSLMAARQAERTVATLTDAVSASTLSPGWRKTWSLRKVEMLSRPALVRVSAIITIPSRTRMPQQ